MQQTRNRRGVVLLLIVAVLAAAVLRAPPAQMIDLGAPGDALFVAGFFAPERDPQGVAFRWSGPHATVYPAASARTPLLLEARLYHDARPIELRRTGQTVATLAPAPTPAWRTYRLLLPAQTGLASWLPRDRLTLAHAPYCPAGQDNRLLGAPIDWLRITPLAPLPLAWALLWGLLLAWALALVWALLPGRAAWLAVGGLALAALWAGWRVPHWLVWGLGWLAWALPPLTLAVLFWRCLPTRAAGRLLNGGRALRWASLGGLWLLGWLALGLAPAPWNGLAAWLVLGTPGALLGWLLWHPLPDRLVRVVLAGTLALLLPALWLLALHALPGVPPAWALLLPAALLPVWLGWLLWQQPAAPPGPGLAPRHGWLLAAGLALAAGLRLLWLGGSEFSGDEARAMVLAMGVQQGQDEVLLLHRKGPLEVLLPALPLVATGHVNELTARLPFALAGLLAVLGAFALARQFFGPHQGARAGLVALALLALDGFLLAFARIVQYQSLVLLCALAALLSGWWFWAGTRWPQRALVGAALCAAGGLLAHYDGLYVLPALALLVLAGGWQRWRTSVRAWLGGLALPVLTGGLLLASFYVPFVLHEHFAQVAAYLGARTGAQAGGMPVNNLPDYYARATFYNTVYVTLAWALALAGGLLLWLGRGLPRVTLPLGVVLLWCGLPFVAHAFVIADPRTHFYTFTVAAALLAGLAVATFWQRWRWLRWPLGLAGGALLGLALPYAWLLYIQQSPEYYRTFPAQRPALYRASYGDTVPGGGHFGFPQRDGWHAAGELLRRGVLQGDYYTNAWYRVGTWYTRGALQCPADPTLFLQATWQTARLPSTLSASGYELAACVVADGQRVMNIYQRGPVPAAPPPAYAVRDYATAWDARPLESFPIQQTLTAWVPQRPTALHWPAGATLTGYDLTDHGLARRAPLLLALAWQAHTPLPVDTRVRLELRDAGGQPVAQAAPICAPLPPAAWSTAAPSITRWRLPVAGLPPGTYTLHVALYDEATGAPLPLADGSADARLTTVELTNPAE